MRQFLLHVAVAVLPVPGLAFCQGQAHLHRIDAQTAEGLRELLQYDGCAMPLLSAHRGGASTGYPENCIATFEHTLRHTFSILEIDLQSTKDGHLVLHHDSTLDRTTIGTGPVYWSSDFRWLFRVGTAPSLCRCQFEWNTPSAT